MSHNSTNHHHHAQNDPNFAANITHYEQLLESWFTAEDSPHSQQNHAPSQDIDILDVLQQELSQSKEKRKNRAQIRLNQPEEANQNELGASTLVEIFRCVTFLMDCCLASFLSFRPFLWYQVIHADIAIPNAKTPSNMVRSILVGPSIFRILVFVCEEFMRRRAEANSTVTGSPSYLRAIYLALQMNHFVSLLLYLFECHLKVSFWIKCVLAVYFAVFGYMLYVWVKCEYSSKQQLGDSVLLSDKAKDA